jgi:putative flippase GtrA
MKIIKYFFVGGIAATVDLTIFFIFAKLFGFNYLVIGAIGFIIATLVNYVISIHVVFNSGARFTKNVEITFIYIVSVIGLATNQMVLYVAIDILSIEMMISKILATGTVFLWNYTMRNYFIFREEKIPKH